MNMIASVLVVSAVLLLGLPFIVFLCAKAAAYGWQRGRQRFVKDLIRNGDSQAKTRAAKG